MTRKADRLKDLAQQYSSWDFPQAKPILASKTAWAGFFTILAGIGSLMSLDVVLAEIFFDLTVVGAGAFAIYGRIVAAQPVRWRK